MSGTARRPEVAGALAVTGAQVAKLGVQVVALLAFTRLLAPADFGVFALLTPFIAITSIARDAGFANAVVRRESITDAELATVFWSNLLVSSLVACGFLLAAAPYARFFGEPVLVELIQATAVLLVTGAMSSQHMALAIRTFRFGLYSAIEAASLVIGLVAGLAHAAISGSIWALWLFPFTTALVSSVAWWVTVSWRPWPVAPVGQVLDIGREAWKIASSSLLDFGSRTLDKILIGRIFGPEPLGFYDRSYKLVLLPLMFVNAPLERYLLPYLSRAREDAAAYRLLFTRSFQAIMLLVSPFIVIAIANPHQVVRILFGPGWDAAAPLVAWLGVACLAQMAIQSLNSVWISTGRSGAMAAVNATGVVTAVAAVVLGASSGLVAVAAIYAVLEVLRMPAVFWWAARSGPIGWRDYAGAVLPFAISVPLSVVLNTAITGLSAGARFEILALEAMANLVVALVCLAASRGGRASIRWAWGLRSLAKEGAAGAHAGR